MGVGRGQLWALLLLLGAFSSIAESHVSRVKRQKCASGLFLCQSGECLQPSQICDGSVDCSDKADENQEICKRMCCPESTFKCSNGACIAASKKCDGKQDCADNSDELLDECPNISKPANGTCPEKQFHCNSGECIDDFSRCDGTKDCKDGSDETLVQCSALSCPGAFFRCGYGACVEEKAACDGTIQCEGDGSDEAPELCGTSPLVSQPQKLESLQEECGKPILKNQSYGLDGKPVLTAEFPWHVGIYLYQDGKFNQVCGGTIIKRKLVLTAAHCFVRSNNTKDYMIGAGKYHRGWDIQDPTEQRLEVESIEITDSYRGVVRNYADDIAIVVLKTEVTITDFVRPVCVDLESKYQRDQLSSGTLGTIVHWDYAGTREPSDAVKTDKLPFREFGECFALLPLSFKPYFSTEKFCAGYVNGPTICAGGAGGGLSFEQEVTPGNKQWFIQGIASLGVPSRTRIPCAKLPILFTDVNKHMNWLKTYYNKY